MGSTGLVSPDENSFRPDGAFSAYGCCWSRFAVPFFAIFCPKRGVDISKDLALCVLTKVFGIAKGFLAVARYCGMKP